MYKNIFRWDGKVEKIILFPFKKYVFPFSMNFNFFKFVISCNYGNQKISAGKNMIGSFAFLNCGIETREVK